MGLLPFILLVILLLPPSAFCQVKEFVSIDCGGTGNYTNSITELEWIPDSGLMTFGRSPSMLNSSGGSRLYQTRRDFPVDDRKYCYTLTTEERRRYLVRVTFRYGDLGAEETFPQVPARNLVPLIGYCEEEHQRILVYEFMHNGTLRNHLHDPIKQKQLIWLTRLKIAEDTAKGLEYLHTGCNPTIIHRDIKTSNILSDVNMRAKVSDFGLSRQADEDLTHTCSVAWGTVGYLVPDFGVVLLELISGRKPVSAEDYGADYNIFHWARALIRRGDVVSVVDPTLTWTYKLESIWRVAVVALQCVEQHSSSRPRMQEIIVAVQDAIKIEKASEENRVLSPGSSKAHSARKTLLTSFRREPRLIE